MTEETEPTPNETLFPKTVGERLRDARVAKHLDLNDVAQATRVPVRHLQAIEDGDYSALPSPTYTVGFAKAYARAVGEDEVAIARDIRGRAEVTAARRPEFIPYETDEPPRTPSSGIMLGALALAILLLVGLGLYFGTSLFRGDGMADPAPAASETFAPEAAPVTAPVAPAGQVTLVANDEVWVRIYDATGKSLFERTLAAGERFDVPTDANNPMINVGRPDKLQILLNGSAVAPLGDGRVAIKDVGISAAALQARAQGAAPAATAPVPAATAPATVATQPLASPSSTTSRSVPPFFRAPAAAPTRRSATPASTGQRDMPVPATTPAPAPAAPENAAGTP